jgi:uncharacterized membrane protein YvbJ
MNFCSNCGAHSIHDLGEYCPRCGTKLDRQTTQKEITYQKTDNKLLKVIGWVLFIASPLPVIYLSDRNYFGIEFTGGLMISVASFFLGCTILVFSFERDKTHAI